MGKFVRELWEEEEEAEADCDDANEREAANSKRLSLRSFADKAWEFALLFSLPPQPTSLFIISVFLL